MIRALILLPAVLLGMAGPDRGCRSSEPPVDRECDGYPCTEAGARAMFESVARRYAPAMTPPGRDAFDRLTAAGLRSMQGQLSPDGFRRAEASLVKIFEAMPLGVEDPMPRGLEEIVSGRSAWCPAWPFC